MAIKKRSIRKHSPKTKKIIKKRSGGKKSFKKLKKSLKKSFKKTKKGLKKSLKKLGGKKKSTPKRKTTKRRSTKRRSTKRKTGGYTKEEMNKIRKEKEIKQEIAEEITGTSNLQCPAGEIARNGYITENGKVVGATCIENRGAVGKYEGQEPIYLEKGEMSQFGYDDLKEKSANARRNAIKRAVKEDGYSTVIKRVNVLYILNKKQNKELAKIAKSDVDWMEEHSNMLKKLEE